MALGKLTVNARSDGFLCDGDPFFWFADTCWSAFTNISLDDWDYYLVRRAEQGMNVLQINTLPQWDRCTPDLGIYPYASKDGIHFDWDAPNQAYWERARTMCQMATEHGLRVALVVMWCNYVPGTWGSKIADKLGAPTIPESEIQKHVERVVKNLGEFDPVYVVTGDTDFKTPEAIAFYEKVLSCVCELAPDQLRTMHINRANHDLPKQYCDRLDFYMFQPGHNYGAQDEAWKLPETFLNSYPKKPMVNSEPCYEQMGASRNVYWRFSAQDCRASVWSSILAGASAGVTYGAHGVWNWQTSKSQGSVLGEGFDMPFRWQECLQFKGVWDFGAIEHLLTILGAGSSDAAAAVEPAQDLLADERESIRVARTGKKVVAYMPRTTKLKLKVASEASSWKATVLDMEQKRVAKVPVSVDGETLVVAQHPFEYDALVVVEPAQ